MRRRQAKGNLITTSEGDHGSVMPFQLLRRGRTPGRVGNTTRFFVASVPCLGAYLGKVPTYSSLQPTLAALNLNALNLQDSPDRNDTYYWRELSWSLTGRRYGLCALSVDHQTPFQSSTDGSLALFFTFLFYFLSFSSSFSSLFSPPNQVIINPGPLGHPQLPFRPLFPYLS